MSQRFSAALLTVGTVLLAGLAIYFVVGPGDESPDSGLPTGLEPATVGPGEGPEPAGPLLGGTPGGGADDPPRSGHVSPRPGAGGVVGLRAPEGVDLGDPAAVRRFLSQVLQERPIDWARVTKLVQVYSGELAEDVRRALLTSLVSGDRVGAVRALGVSRDGTLTRDLLGLLDDPDLTRAAQRAIIRTLGGLPGAIDAEVVRGLEARFTGDSRDDVPMLQAIGSRGGREAARAIVEYLQRSDSPESLPRYGLLGLDLVKDEHARTVVISALQSAENPKVQQALVRLAAQAGATQMVEPLLELDRSNPPPDVRRDLLSAFASIGTPAAVDRLLEVGQQPGTFGETALKNVGRIRSATPEARTRLVSALEDATSSSNQEVRLSLMRALANLGEQKALPAMVRALDDPDVEVRKVAVRAIGNTRSAGGEHIDSLVSAFSTGDDEMKKRVVVALASIGGSRARSVLEQMKTSGSLSPIVIRNVVAALQRVRETETAASGGAKLGGTER